MKKQTKQNKKYKKGSCYASAANWILDHSLFMSSSENQSARLVHGKPTLTRAPFKKYGHAWIEINNACLDTESEKIIPKILFYAIGKINPEECVYYTSEEVRNLILEFEHYGPWEK